MTEPFMLQIEQLQRTPVSCPGNRAVKRTLPQWQAQARS